MEKKPKVAMVFGVFDILHAGHKHFIESASFLAEKLVIVLASDENVLNLKGEFPINMFNDRLQSLSKLFPDVKIVKGDDELGKWNIVSVIKPDLIIFGYDQEKMKEALSSRAGIFSATNLVSISKYKDGSLHSSTLRKML
ncbi:MAG: hypothetical protein EXS46_02170 [Candidatus Taylorbacteria bacterium]|nr:hypothetical protein [Candidatus Taylorbacteria bacterium]